MIELPVSRAYDRPIRNIRRVPMIKQSPTVMRIVAVLNFFLEHPQQIYTLAQVVKSLRLNRATTHSILLGLVDAGYLYRRSDKTYILGPVLPSLAANAQPLLSPFIVASHEMRGLADELDVIAAAIAREGSEIVVQERASSVNHLGSHRIHARGRYPLLPWGAAFLMNTAAAEAEEKLNKIVPPLSETLRRDVRTQLACGRKYGFIVAVSGETEPSTVRNDENFDYLTDIAPEKSYKVAFMVVPIFGAAGEVALCISINGFPDSMTGQAVLDAGKRLLQTCTHVTTFIRGRQPAAFPQV